MDGPPISWFTLRPATQALFSTRTAKFHKMFITNIYNIAEKDLGSGVMSCISFTFSKVQPQKAGSVQGKLCSLVEIYCTFKSINRSLFEIN